MKDLFPGHYKPSEEEFKKLWAECIFVFDTNILLNVYRYSEKTRDRLFEVLELLQDRIWLPYQVAYEYQEERLNVISHQLKPYEDIEKVLAENLDRLNSVIDNYRNRHSFTSLVNDKKIISTTRNANKRTIKVLEEAKQQYPNLIEHDPYREKIGELFKSKIGTPHTEEKLKEIHAQCKSRFEKEIPPGYKDKNKSVEQKQYGDAVLWLQIIEYAKSQNKPIIFVTDDNKKDWWKRHQGQTISPRTELIEEIKKEANVDFWMYTGDRFLMYVEEYLKLNEQPEAIEEAEEVRINDEVIELKKFAQPLSISPTVANQLDLFNRSMQDILDKAKKSFDPLRADYFETTAKAIKAAELLQAEYRKTVAKAIGDLEIISKIPHHYPNYQISRNISELNEEDEDIIEED